MHLVPNITTDSSIYSSVSPGGYHTCGIRANDSRVLCWGYGNYGQLGDGNNASHSVLRPNITTDSSPYKKGFSSSEEVLVSILGNAYLNVGQNWSLGCRSYDFTSYSDWMNSSVMTINTAPVMQTVKINSTTNSSTENIKGFCNATDFEGSDLGYQYQWYNGSTLSINGTIFKEGSISAGWYSACGIRANDSRVVCWGYGAFGVLGDGSTTDNLIPNVTADASAYKSVSVGDSHACGIRQNDSRVLCWGRCSNDACGDGQTTIDRYTPYPMTDSSEYLMISASNYYTCGIRANDSRVLCWGWGDRGEMGDGISTAHTNPIATLTTDTSGYKFITTGDDSSTHSCGIRSNDSKVLCWGNGYAGQLGDGIIASHEVGNPTLINDASPYLIITSGYDNTCGIRQSDKRVLCWGSGTEGEIGNGNNVDVGTPTLTLDSSAYSSITGGFEYYCGIRTNDSRVLCWGWGDYGELGDSSTAVHNTLFPNLTVDNSSYVKGFSSGNETLVSTLASSFIKKGENWKISCRAYDFTSYSSWMNSTTMTILNGPPVMATVKINSTTNTKNNSIYGYCNATDEESDDLAYQYQWYNGSTVYFNGTLFKEGSISTGHYFSCGIRANDSRVLCWGQGLYGQLGDGQNTINRTSPYLTTDISSYSSISTGYFHACGIRANDSRVLCWGRGEWGNLGDSEITNHLVPNLTTDSSAYSSVSAGGYHTCGIRANDSRVLCWGYGNFGELGDSETGNNLRPNITTDSSSYSNINTGGYHTCGIRTNDSRVLCWGYGLYGQVGDSETGNNLQPNVTKDTSAYSSISAGEVHTCGIRANDSRVLCWGESQYGRLGDTQNGVDVLNPNLTTDSSPYTIANAGYLHTCGIRQNDSRVLCWGYGANGQLGDGENPNNLIPNITTDSSIYSSVSPGGYHTCGIRANDSRVLCWGFGTYGQLGDGSNASHNTLNPNITTDSSPYKKGFSSSEEVLVSILGNAYLNVGQNWSFGCRAYDFTNYSSWMNSSILIVNTAPIMRTVKINSTTNSSTENIKGYCNATDFEGSNLAYGYTWYNGSTVYFDGTYFRKNSLALGENHVCGIRANDSRVLCWGDSAYGQLGDGQTTTDRASPYLTNDSLEYLGISAEKEYTCGIRANDSRVLCWGLGGNGELGNGSISDSGNPQITSDNSAYSMITTGYILTCGIRKSDSRVLCWGYNYYGTLGDGTTTDKADPTLTTDNSAYLDVNMNYHHTCGIRANDSRVLCWGNNWYGELGNGTTSSYTSYSPRVTVDTSPYISDLSVQGNETLVSILGSAFLNAGETWKFGCRAYDFSSYSSWMNSSTMYFAPPSCEIQSITELTNTSYQDVDGNYIWYYNPSYDGSVQILVNTTDTDVDTISFPTTVSAGANDTTDPYSVDYTWDTADTYNQTTTITINDSSGNLGNCSFDIYRDSGAPIYHGYNYVGGASYVNGTDYWVTGGDNFLIKVNHSDVGSGVWRQYFGYNKDDCNPNGCGGSPYEIKSYKDTVYADWYVNNSYLDIISATCNISECYDSLNVSNVWNTTVALTSEDWDFKMHTYEYDMVTRGLGYTDMGIWLKVDNSAPISNGTTQSSSYVNDFNVSTYDFDNRSGLSSCSYRIHNGSAYSLGWTSRTCNANINVDISSYCASGQNCTIVLNSTDQVGLTSSTFNVSVSITSVSSGAGFFITNNTNGNVALFDKNGNFYLKGKKNSNQGNLKLKGYVVENYFSYILSLFNRMGLFQSGGYRK